MAMFTIMPVPALRFLLLLMAALFPGTWASASWSKCDTKVYPVTVHGVTVSPDPVVSGSEAKFVVPAYTDKEITGGTLVITVYFHSIPVHSERDDLCLKTACPIRPGEFTLTNSEVLPGITPPGSYKIKLQILDESGSVLACAYVNFDIVWDWSSAAGGEANVMDVFSIVQHNSEEKSGVSMLAEK